MFFGNGYSNWLYLLHYLKVFTLFQAFSWVFLMCFMDILRVLKGCLMGVSRVLKFVSRVFQSCSIILSCVVWWCFKDFLKAVSEVFLEQFNNFQVCLSKICFIHICFMFHMCSGFYLKEKLCFYSILRCSKVVSKVVL